MRKYLAGFVVAALAIGLVGTAIGGPTPIVQSISGPKLKPTKLNKKKKKNASLTVKTSLDPVVDGGPIPQKATLVNVDFGKNISLNHKATKVCKDSVDELAGTTRSAALDLCGKSKVSKDGSTISPGRAGAAGVKATKGSMASAALPFGPGGTAVKFPVDVMAFNGGKKVLALWTRVPALSVTTILPGALEKAPGKKFGTRLAVTVPPLAGGTGALDEFQAQVKKKDYVQANCKSNKKKTPIKGAFTFSDAPSVTVKDSSKIKKCNKNK